MSEVWTVCPNLGHTALIGFFLIQFDQLYMALCFWYLVKVTCPVYNVHVYSSVYWARTFHKVLETQGNVYLVTLCIEMTNFQLLIFVFFRLFVVCRAVAGGRWGD